MSNKTLALMLSMTRSVPSLYDFKGKEQHVSITSYLRLDEEFFENGQMLNGLFPLLLERYQRIRHDHDCSRTTQLSSILST